MTDDQIRNEKIETFELPELIYEETSGTFKARISSIRDEERALRKEFVKSAMLGSKSKFFKCLNDAIEIGALESCVRALLKAGIVHENIKSEFIWTIKNFGDGIRQEFRHELTLVKALRILLPAFSGKDAIKIFRGDSAFNRKRRTYGFSWSTDIETARSFALGHWRTCDGGSVLLEASACPNAILWAFPAEADPYGEAEVLIDRRHLENVRVLERFSQITIEEHAGGT